MKINHNSACSGCRHWRPLYDKGLGNIGQRVCHYILDTGHARGCPAGEGCKRYDKRRPGERFQDIDFAECEIGVQSVEVVRTSDGVKIADLQIVEDQEV